jgi:cellulose synthase/poly-beta-1,6-N-acetylglucosamine synthase-like glycosyltransferase
MNALSFGALFVILYAYAGYPALALGLASVTPRRRAHARAHALEPYEPSVSVCMAVHNGAQYLEPKLRSIQALDYPDEKLEILIYSDGSTDLTEQRVLELAASDPRIRLVRGQQRLGKPTALNRLRAEAQGEILLMTDVRQALAPNALRALVRDLADPAVGCVSGNLVLRGDTGAGVYWRYEKLIRGAEARLGNMVGVSGSIYAIRREDLRELPSDVLLDDMFVPLSVLQGNKRVALSPDAEAYDHAYADEQEFGRKVRTLAGNYQLVAKLPWLLVPFKNPVWFQFVSHKLLRLVCPWALLILLVSSLLLAQASNLPDPERLLWATLAIGQIAFYALAVLGARAGRLGALARTFVVLNLAAVVGLWRFLRGSQAIAW